MSTTSGPARGRRARPPPRRRRRRRRPRCRARAASSCCEAGAHEAVVVGEQHADHASGTSTRRRSSPDRAPTCTSSAPPRSWTRSRSTRRPKCPSAGRPSTRRVEAAAVVGDRQDGAAVLDAQRDDRGASRRRAGRVAQRLLGAAEQQRSASSLRSRSSERQVVGRPAGRRCARGRRAPRRAPRGAGSAGRCRRAACAGRERCGGSGRRALASAAAGRVGARRSSRPGRERVGDADEVLHDAVVQVGRDPPALGLRGVQRALQERLALALAVLQARTSERASGRLTSHSSSRPPSRAGANARPSRWALADTEPEPLVGLEQQRPAARPVDRQVDLEQLVGVALEEVLRPGSRLTSASTPPSRRTARSSAPSGKRLPISRGSSE